MTDEEQTLRDIAEWPARDLANWLLTTDHMPGPADPEVLAWLTGLGLDPASIPATDLVIDPDKMRLYWCEFWRDADGVKTATTGGRYRRTGPKSMPLDSLPAFLN